MQIEWNIGLNIEIFVDQQPWKIVRKSLFLKELSALLKAATEEELQEIFSQIETRVAKEAALFLLARRSYFTQELAGKLRQKKLSSTSITYAISECQRLGYLDDALRTKSLVASQKARGVGPRLIALKLRQKSGGVKCEELEVGALDAARLYLDKRFKKRVLTREERQKAFMALQRRGFDLNTIQELLRSD